MVSPGLALPNTTYKLLPSPTAMSSYWSLLNLPRLAILRNAGWPEKPVRETPSPLANGRVRLAAKDALPKRTYMPSWLPRPAKSRSEMPSPLKSVVVT